MPRKAHRLITINCAEMTRSHPIILAGLPFAFACTALLSWLFVAHPPGALAADFAQPVIIATTWHEFGRALWLLVFAGVLAASIPYASAVHALLRGTLSLRLWHICTASACALIACLTMPVIFSSDIYAYAAYGWMDAHGISPYTHLPLETHDPLITSAIWQWGNPLPACVYGPLFVWIAKVCVLAGSAWGPVAPLFFLRLLSCGALVACGSLVWLALGGWQREKRLAAAAAIALNPVAIWSAAEGHNDTIMLAVVLAGFIAVRRFGYLAGALVVTASALIKASGLGAAAGLALFAWSDRKRFLKVVAGIAGGAALTAFFARPFESGVRTILIPHAHYAPQFSAQFAAWQVFQALFGTRSHALESGVTLALVGAGALAISGARRALRGDFEGFAFLAIALWLAIPNPYPWYALWILPVAVLRLRAPVSCALLASSITIFARYLPDVSSTSNPDFNVLVTFCEFALPMAILAARTRLFPSGAAFEAE